MQNVPLNIAAIDWQQVAESMHSKGFALVPKFLNHEQCEHLKTGYSNSDQFRKTVVMERYRFGQGEYKYYSYPLPDLIQSIREHMYAGLAPIANKWMKDLNLEMQYPSTFQQLTALCHASEQVHPTALILKYGKGGHNTMHQDLYGSIYFPIQIVLFLNEPEVDYTGGEFVLMETLPRAQSKAIVLQPKMGDLLIFTTNFRPVKGSKGFYKVNMKHGVSEIHGGERHTLGIIFHDALS